MWLNVKMTLGKYDLAITFQRATLTYKDAVDVMDVVDVVNG